MLILWTAVGILGIVGGVMGQSHVTASGCFAMTGCNAFLSMHCSADRRIFILKAQYGRKSAGSTCSTRPPCGDCCTPEDSDCFDDYSNEIFRLMYYNSTCWNGTSCQPRVHQGNTPCGLSTFAVAHYSCLRGDEVTYFHDSTTITAPAVAIHYNHSDVTSYPIADTDSYKTWHCQVDTANSVQLQADVILVREQDVHGHKPGSSSLGWSGGGFLDHVNSFRYARFNATTAFLLSLRVGKGRRLPDGWAVVRAQDGSNLTVQCGYTDDMSTASTISARETAASTFTMQTTFSSMASINTTPTRTQSGSSQSDVHLGVVVAGWVLAAVLAVCLGVFICRLGGCKGVAQLCSKEKTTSGRPPTPRDQTGDNTYLEVIPYNALPSPDTSPAEVYVNADSVSPVERRPESQQEYSPLDWSRDPANAYSQLGQA